MMLFKFDIKYVKLNFKAIASMEFNFDVKLTLSMNFLNFFQPIEIHIQSIENYEF